MRCLNLVISPAVSLDGTPHGYVVQWADMPSWTKDPLNPNAPIQISGVALSYMGTLAPGSDGDWGVYLDVGKEYCSGCNPPYPASQTGPTIKMAPLNIHKFIAGGPKTSPPWWFSTPMAFTPNDCLVVDYGGTGGSVVQLVWDMYFQ